MKIKLIFATMLTLIACTSVHQTEMPESEQTNQVLQPKDLNVAQTQAPEAATTSTKSPMSDEKSYEMKKLDNGLTVFAIHKEGVPMVTVLIAVKNGAFVETPDINGLAHLYEHMFFKANDAVPSQQAFLKALGHLGVELGPNMNAYTSTESVRYFFTIQSRYLKDGVQFMANAVRTPKFLPDELERERKVVIGEFDRYESSPVSVFYQKDILQRLFTKYYYRKSVIGDRNVILSATPEQMHGIQHRFYIPNNAAIFVVGNFNDADLWDAINTSFKDWAKGPDPFVTNPIPEHPPLKETKTLTKEAPAHTVQTVNIVQSYQGPSLTIDNKGTIVFDLLGVMLGMESSPFQKELVQSGLAFSADFGSESQRYTSPLFFSLETTPDKAQKAYDTMKALIDQMAKGNFFTQKDLDMAKTSTEVHYAYRLESGQNYALDLAGIWTNTGNLDYYNNYIPQMKQISLQDIDQTLKTYIQNAHYVAGALTPSGIPPLNFGNLNGSQTE